MLDLVYKHEMKKQIEYKKAAFIQDYVDDKAFFPTVADC